MDDENGTARDPKVITCQPSNVLDNDIEDHRACTVYIGYHVPAYRKRGPHKRYHRHHHKPAQSTSVECDPEANKSVSLPSERVHFILGEDEDGSHEPHPLFSEMEELFQKGDEIEWRETARWIKFEEDVEEGGNRWSKPHVATVSFHSLLKLRSCLINGSILLDLDAHTLDQISDSILDNLESNQIIASDVKQSIKDILLRPHRHLHEIRQDWSEKSSRVSLMRSWTDGGTGASKITSHNVLSFWTSFTPHTTSVVEEKTTADTASASIGMLCDTITTSLYCRALSQAKAASPEESASENCLYKLNQAFMKKIPSGAEASNLLVGEVDFLQKPTFSFVRLNESCHLGDLTEVPVPTRFLFVLLGPTGEGIKYHEIGRAMAALLSDEVFHNVAYKARNRDDLLAGLDEFLDVTTVLPPGVWDPRTRIEPPLTTASQDGRKKPEIAENECEHEDISDNMTSYDGQDASCNEKLFEGLRADIRCKSSWYLSDFKDCISLQCISSVVFLYFVCISQIVLFGGALGSVTKQRIAATECLISAFICGVTYSLTSGQPLTLLGVTGPVLAFESLVFEICELYSINYLPFRVWIGIWTSIYLFIFVAFNMASLVRYITRFTEEIFAVMVSCYFIYKAFKNLIQIGKKFPIITKYTPYNPMCICILQSPVNFSINTEEQCRYLNGISAPFGCSYTPTLYVPNIFLMSIMLFSGTLCLILLLRKLKNMPYFPIKVRTAISEFSVLIAVIFMTGFDLLAGFATPKLEVPDKFQPTWHEREWLVPFFGENAWWSALLAMLPALLLTLLIFMDQQITSVIVNRKENKLKKGRGYHLDLFIVTILIAVCSILGLPWFIAGTVLSITHKGRGYHLDLFIVTILIAVCSILGLPWFIAGTVLSITHKGRGYHSDLFIVTILIAVCSILGLPWFIAGTVLSITHKGRGYHLDLFIVNILIAVCSILGLPWFIAGTVLSITHKGRGYHLDLFIVTILIAVCSILGLPWFVAGTVLSMTHKGRGYHLDLFIVTILIAVCSILGLPWFVAGTVLSITHKGRGYHLDLFIVSILIAVCSILGLPWFVAGTVLSMTHVNSLRIFCPGTAPGEKAHFLGIREQRVTHFCIFVLVGISVFLTKVLQLIPMPVFYGIFLFMGVTSLNGLQFVDRIQLFLMPEKYQPDYSYVRFAPMRLIFAYTFLQLSLCSILFICKLFRYTAFAFPVLLVAVIFCRKGLSYVYDKRQLKLLDDEMPERSIFKKNDSSISQSKHSEKEKSQENVVKSRQNSHANINISEVLMQSNIWKCIDQQSQKTSKNFKQVVKCNKKKKHSKRDASKFEDCKRLSVMEEEGDEEYTNSATDTPSSPLAPNSMSDSTKSYTNRTLV